MIYPETMQPLDWTKLTYMTLKDNWGDPYKMNKALVFKLEALRIHLGVPCVLTTSAYATTGHTDKSQHALGRAVDCRFGKLALLEMYLGAERFGFTGIGLYPNNGRPFIHLDNRIADTGARWIAVGDPNNWTYVALNEENIRKYVI